MCYGEIKLSRIKGMELSTPQGSPPPASGGGAPASQSPSLPTLSSRGPAQVSSLPLFPLIPLPDAALKLKPQPPQQTSSPSSRPHATGRGHWPTKSTSLPNGSLLGAPGLHLGCPRASCGRFPLPGACSRCWERGSAGAEGISVPQPLPPQQKHQERPGQRPQAAPGDKAQERHPTVTGV